VASQGLHRKPRAFFALSLSFVGQGDQNLILTLQDIDSRVHIYQSLVVNETFGVLDFKTRSLIWQRVVTQVETAALQLLLRF